VRKAIALLFLYNKAEGATIKGKQVLYMMTVLKKV